MHTRLNEFQQPIGYALADWTPAKQPSKRCLSGRLCRLERLDVATHADNLYQAFAESPDARHWTYLPYGPFETADEYRAFLTGMAELNDPFHYAVVEPSTGKAIGTISLMRIDVANGVIEVGHVVYSPQMQRTPLSTEVMALLQQYVFEELGYRRLEWKCDALNGPSRAAAERFGFTFEGIFRQLQVTQGRNRDTAWYSMLDHEYAQLKSAYQTWLSTDNFDGAGQQINKLADLINQGR
ncbi:acetyltransferase [Shewanella mangrovi]|uniref:Acetyltransferase n=1 Tax=Shewanella mangrovi TaxID=1515746 RepID=A0A094JVM7_9GAMM|nr:GNAT family protein [Shewanella mangrovi]KFZ36496.1 acetyltransferase [Shewanella mangrovi]